MMSTIELPVGARFKATIDNELLSVVVEEADGCKGCVFGTCNSLCIHMRCEGVDRTDFTPVKFVRAKGGAE